MQTCPKGHDPYLDGLKQCPICKKEYRKAYYAKNKEKEKEQVKVWMEANRDSVLERKREYNRTNKDKHHGWYENRIAKRKYDTIWRGMIERCYNPNHHKYPIYGYRGITVCDRWRDKETGYENFEADMGPRPSPLHSIDRRDNNGHYEPGNVRWATKKEQQRNRRANHLVTLGGRTQCIAEWAEELGLTFSAFQGRLNKGWSEKRLLLPNSQPDQMRKRRSGKMKPIP